MPSRTPLPALPTLRLATVPDGAPPYDCQAHGTACAACPADRDAAGTSPAAVKPPPPAAPATSPAAVKPPPPAAPATSPAAAGKAASWPRQFALVVVEILAGARPERQIAPWTTDRARAQIRRMSPLFASDRRPRVQRIVTSWPTAHVAEMTVVASFGARTRALAIRFEHVAGRQTAPGLPARPARWLCTEIEAG